MTISWSRLDRHDLFKRCLWLESSPSLLSTLFLSLFFFFFTGIWSLSFPSPPGYVYKPLPLLFYSFNWLDVTDYIHPALLEHRPLASTTESHLTPADLPMTVSPSASLLRLLLKFFFFSFFECIQSQSNKTWFSQWFSHWIVHFLVLPQNQQNCV